MESILKLFNLILLGTALFLATTTAVAADKQQPNVLFIVCDDLTTRVSTSGFPDISTPAFDQLAAAGMTFKRAYCQYPVCGPSRASFLHGLYPQATGVLNNKIDIRDSRPNTTSMPQSFQEKGYWTGSVGKIYHQLVVDPGEAVWDEFLRFENDELPLVTAARKEFEAKHGPIGNKGKNRRLWKKHIGSLATQTRGQKRCGYGPSGLRDEQHNDGKNVRQVASWLDNQSYGDKPFFIACGIHKPHVPFIAPDAYFDMYPKENLRFSKTPADFWDQAPFLASHDRYKKLGFELGVENDMLRREYTQAYHACISFIDAQIGLLFESLKRNGQWDNTIVVLTSDHGYQLGEHFLWGKVTLFEVCDRVPMIIRVPEMTKPGTTSEGLVELIDLYPTLSELCDITPPNDIHGRSIVPMLRDPAAAGKETVYTVVSRGKQLGKAIRTTRWRYALWPDGEELYDLTNDPAEHKNLVTSNEHAATLAEMRSHLLRMESIALAGKR